MQNVIHFGHKIVVLLTLLVSPLSALTAAEDGQIAIGKDLYNKNCVFCHQADAIGKVGFAPSLTNAEFLANASNKFILGTIRDGRMGTGMPPFAHLGRDGIKAIVTYLRSHSKLTNKSAEIDKQDTARGDPRLGQIWFDQICSTCHGVNGDGYAAGGTGTAIGNASFLNKATDGFIRQTIKQGRSGTRMRGYSGAEGLANLSAREIDDIIVYMRTLAK
jgi:cbb3-type cytochrome c oxidase subunit III